MPNRLRAAIDRFLRIELSWTYRPTTMRPPMRRRSFFGINQCQIRIGGKWVKAPFPETRYQWSPVARKQPATPPQGQA